MEIKRFNPRVDVFNYYSKNRAEEILSSIEVNLNVGFTPLQINYPASYGDASVIGVRLDFTIPLKEFVISGSVSQVNSIQDREIEEMSDFSSEEIDELIEPLLSIIHRLTYDVSEIAFDEPGIALDFDQIKNDAT